MVGHVLQGVPQKVVADGRELVQGIVQKQDWATGSEMAAQILRSAAISSQWWGVRKPSGASGCCSFNYGHSGVFPKKAEAMIWACADGLGGFSLHVLLVLLGREAELPEDPAELFSRLETRLRRRMLGMDLVEKLARVIGLELVNHILHRLLREV